MTKAINSDGLDAGDRVLATARPSRAFEVAAGRTWWTGVDLFEGSGTGAQAAAVRAALETMYIRVDHWPTRNRRAALEVLAGTTSTNPYLLLSAHCSKNRVLFQTSDPDDVEHSFGVDDIASWNLKDRVVISLGCNSGDRPMVDAFHAAGVAAYVAPVEPPFGHAVAMFASLVFFGLTQYMELDEAVDRAGQFDRELTMWRVFRPA